MRRQDSSPPGFVHHTKLVRVTNFRSKELEPSHNLTTNKRELIEDLVRIESDLLRALPADEETVQSPAAAGQWSPAEHILHVALNLEVVARGFVAIVAGEEDGAEPPALKKSLAKKLVLSTWRIPSEAQTSESTQPRIILRRAELKTRLREARDELVALVHDGRASVQGLLLEHPYLGGMNFSDWIRFLLIHALHHKRLMRRSLR